MTGAKPCSYCGALVLWANTATGKRMPIDAEPVELGNVRLVEGPGGYLAMVTAPAMIPEGERYRSHFATCPRARAARHT
jgi:hypothetical protein